MRITEIRDTTVPIRSDIRNAVVSFSEMTASAVAIHTDVMRDDNLVVGYGFNSNGRYAQQGILRDRIISRLLRAVPKDLINEEETNFDPVKAWAVMMMNEKPGGHGDRSVAIGAVDMALWDIVAKVDRKPLYRLLAERFSTGNPDPRVRVYAAGGYYYPGKDIMALREEIQSYLDAGYQDAKIKIGGAPLQVDLQRIEAVLKLVPSGMHLAVDANGRFGRETALAYTASLAPYGLKWYEEPCDPLDYQLLAEVASASSTPLATGENLFSVQEVRNLIRYGSLNKERDTLQMDPALSYGLVEYRRILDMLVSAGWSTRHCVPHGGHQMSLHIAAGLGLGGNEAYPGIFEPFGGFADDQIVERGYVRCSEDPGIGIELNSDLYKLFRELL